MMVEQPLPKDDLEGHARLTAYLLRPEALPAELLALVGYAPEFADK